MILGIAALGIIAVVAGAIIAGRPLIISKEKAIRLAGGEWGGTSFEKNVTAQALYQQGRATRSGLVFMVGGAILELLALLIQVAYG